MSASKQDTQPPEEHSPSVTREKIFHYPAHFLAPNWNRKPGLEDTIWKLVKNFIVFSSRIPFRYFNKPPAPLRGSPHPYSRLRSDSKVLCCIDISGINDKTQIITTKSTWCPLTHRRRGGKCMFNSLAYNCDYKDAIGNKFLSKNRFWFWCLKIFSRGSEWGIILGLLQPRQIILKIPDCWKLFFLFSA